jgi:hypothetical protein
VALLLGEKFAYKTVNTDLQLALVELESVSKMMSSRSWLNCLS